MSKFEEKADWLAIVIHFVPGFLFGCFIAFFLSDSDPKSIQANYWMGSDFLLYFILGGGFIMGSITSYYGDRIWARSAYRVIRPVGVCHSRGSFFLIIGLCILGGMMILACILRAFSRVIG